MNARTLVFASGSATGGGSGFKNLVETKSVSRPNLAYDIVGVVTHHVNGGVVQHAQALRIPCTVISPKVSKEEYRFLVEEFDAELVALSGWLRPVVGLPPEKVINIHPGPLRRFGGHGMYGHHVHEAVIEAFRKGEIRETAMSMHFVDPYIKTADGDNYDKGPVFAEIPIGIVSDDTADSLGKAVNGMEHMFQPLYTSLVAEGRIALRQGKVWMENEEWRYGRDLPFTF